MGLALLLGTLYWYTYPPSKRRMVAGRNLLRAIFLFSAWVAVSRDRRGVLWFAAVLAPLTVIPLFWLGRMPADMPLARDPAVRHHPQYREFRRRGIRAGFGIVAGVLAAAVLSAVSVRGLS